jgi:succinate-semialdehyde dehydrogenase/glutarate-semialdehyde dehydrogenase
MAVLKSVNPYNPARIVNYPQAADKEIEERLDRAVAAFGLFRNQTFKERALKMNQAATLLRARKRELAEIITGEMGKPVSEAEAEVEKCAWVCGFYAEHAAEFLKTEHVTTEARESKVLFQPLGPVLAIMPWNFPFWQVFRFAAPALMAGNTALLKHASNVQGCALAIEDLLLEAGFEKGVFQNLAISSDRVAGVLAMDMVRAVTLTGSEAAGVAVAAEAGRHLKKCVLELGGNNAFVVLNDADLELALQVAMPARLQNGGQSCIAAKRFILEQGIAGDFVEGLVGRVSKLVVGDPMLPETEVGPLSSGKQALEVEQQVNRSISMGARLLLGGKRDGTFFEPTILAGAAPGMPVFDEEVFGPVFSITEAGSAARALELSNQSRYGLGMQLFTRSDEEAAHFIEAADEGAVFVNAMVKSDPRLPFGGVKRSGFGRELSREGIREFVNVKTIWIA